MRWNDTILSDDTSLNVTSIAFGNNYYVASLDELATVIVNIIKDNTFSITNSVEEVSW